MLYKTKQLFDFITFLVSVSCACLGVWSINIYRNTFIDWKILIAPVMMGIIIFSVVFWRILVQIGYRPWAIIFIAFTCGGSLSHLGMMYLNKRFAQTNSVTNVFYIERKGTLAKGRYGCEKPYAVVNFDNLEKDLVFTCDLTDSFEEYSKIKISYVKGFLGFNVIKERMLLK